ncbi:MAG: hypothetical protein ACE5GO_01060, partial [Anaerolineales bacterium]
APRHLPLATPPPGYVAYTTQSGDTLAALAARCAASPGEILCVSPEAGPRCPTPNLQGSGDVQPNTLPLQTLFPAGQLLFIPYQGGRDYSESEPSGRLLPDSEVIFTAPAANFDVAAYLEEAGGYLHTHRQYLMLNGWNTGADIIDMIATENAINPRLLLGLLAYQCKCVLGNPGTLEEIEPFMGTTSTKYLRADLYGQLDWSVHQLSLGYYGWRDGGLTEFVRKDGTIVRPAPDLNAGTAALQYFFAQLYGEESWRQALDPQNGFPGLYAKMFGDPWERETVIFPPDAAQPAFILPFEPGTTWSYTGGPHPAFEGNGPLASLDFAPASAEPGCLASDAWVLAVAGGVVVRSEYGLITLDTDGDGLEQTGWNVMYLHIEERDRVQVGDVLQTGDLIGHPSCDGGVANGTHVHIARKYNGEWIPADGPLAFNLGGWAAHKGEKPYLGTLTRNGETLTACTCSWEAGWIVMEDE